MSDIDVSPFLDAYVFANTPEYLFRHVMANPALADIARSNSVESLMQEVSAADAVGNESVTSAVRGYVALLALLYRNERASIDALRLCSPTRLRWLPALVATWDRLRVPTSVQMVGNIGRVGPMVTSTSSSASSALQFGNDES